MIRCEIEKMGEEKCNVALSVDGEAEVLLNEVRAIVSGLFVDMTNVMPFRVAESLILHAVADGMSEGGRKVMGAGEK